MFFFLKNLFVIEGLLIIGMMVCRYVFAKHASQVVSAKMIAITLATPIVGLFAGNVYIFYAYLACVVAFNSRSRTELAATYVAVLPAVPALSSETEVMGVYLAAFSTILAMNFGALLGALITSPKRMPTTRLFDGCIIAIILIFFYIDGREVSATALLRGVSVNVISFAGPFLLLSRGVRTRSDVEFIVLRLIYGATLCSLVGMFQTVRHWITYETMYPALHVVVPLQSWTTTLRGGLLRTGGSMLDYGAAGVFLAAMVCLLPFVRPLLKGGRFWLLTAVLVAGLLATQSRGAWLAALVGLVFMLLYHRRYGIAALFAFGAVALEGLILTVAKSGRLASILGATTDSTGTLEYRQQLAVRGFDQIRAHPIFGQTPQGLIANLPDLVQGQHIVDFVNGHLFIAMAAGVPLFAVWLTVWVLPVIRAWQSRRLASPNADLAQVPAAIIVPAMVALVSTSYIDRNLVWPTIALALAAPCFALARSGRAARSWPRPAGLVSALPHIGDRVRATMVSTP